MFGMVAGSSVGQFQDLSQNTVSGQGQQDSVIESVGAHSREQGLIFLDRSGTRSKNRPEILESNPNIFGVFVRNKIHSPVDPY